MRTFLGRCSVVTKRGWKPLPRQGTTGWVRLQLRAGQACVKAGVGMRTRRSVYAGGCGIGTGVLAAQRRGAGAEHVLRMRRATFNATPRHSKL